MVNVVRRISNFVREFKVKLDRKNDQPQAASFKEAELVLIKDAQKSCYPDKIRILTRGSQLDISHPLAQLTPILDDAGQLRVGGRLNRSSFGLDIRNPLLLPEHHPVTRSLLHYYHEQVQHQGRHLTHGAIRTAGLHIVNAKKLIRMLLRNCVWCKRLRGKLETPQMANLPMDRLAQLPAFTNTGLDIFGPFHISEGQTTRRFKTERKVWGVLFTCLVTRAIHIEILPAVDTSSLRNAMRRFFAIRGPCQVIRSDRGTNIIGHLNQEKLPVDMNEVRLDLENDNRQWILNPPHASHFGGVWERKIGSVRRILEGAILKTGPKQLNRDELHTLFMEAMAIVNATPLWEVSADPNDPAPITPNMLLTLKELPTPQFATNFDEKDLVAIGQRRWRRVQMLAEEFWKSWRQNYLQELQSRRKWIRPTVNLKPGDYVLIRDKLLKRNQWPLGLVNEVRTSSDGQVRSAQILIMKKTERGLKKHLYERPAHDLVVLVPSSVEDSATERTKLMSDTATRSVLKS
eukprot:TRINITY_DN7584_c0_g1_i1.p1 TRINITY_DN7584_c0_g1~~TRINITY_DN7584_c0_g1_i1.p1  ORF type:complete len:574 (+),score=14.54 TRINITY_DN7584_c0_g1_i1:174-1724(+)